jgi:hypothetical protein
MDENFLKGDIVMVLDSKFANYKTKSIQPKFNEIYSGPYIIKAFNRSNRAHTYRLNRIYEEDGHMVEGDKLEHIPHAHLKRYAKPIAIHDSQLIGRKNKKVKDAYYFVEFTDKQVYWVDADCIGNEYTYLIEEYENSKELEDVLTKDSLSGVSQNE